MKNCLISKSLRLFLVVSIILYISFSNVLSSQEIARYSDTLQIEQMSDYPNIWGVGIVGGMLLNNHYVDFHALPNVPSCCPDYKTGFGVNYSLGTYFDYKLPSAINLFAEVRVSYSNIGGTIKAEEKELMFKSPTESALGTIEHTINTSINTFSLEPVLMYSLFENAYLHLGMSYSLITNTSFEQKEILIEPKDLTFENGSKIRMNYGGKIPGVTNHFSSLVGGFNYEFPLNNSKKWFLTPEFFLIYDMNDIIPKEKWKVLSYRMALGVNFRQSLELLKRFEQYERIDTVKIELPQIATAKFIYGQPKIYYDSLRVKNVLTIKENYLRTDTLYYPPEYVMTGSLKITALEDNGNEIQSPDIRVEEFLYNKMKPLLNYIFFDSNSSILPDRYKLLTKEESNEFTLNKAFTKEELGFYHNILNVIGLKLRQNQDANITLIGHNCNMDIEKNNLILSQNRAQAVKDYLTNIWQINPNRITVKAHNLPETASNNRAVEGQQENRRVEIVSENFRITSSLIARDTVLETTFIDKNDSEMRKLNFGGFRIYTAVNSEREIKDWKVTLVQGKDTLKSFSGTGNIPPYQDWTIKSDINTSELLSKPINIILAASDINNKHVSLQETPKVLAKTIASKRQNRESDTKKDSYSMMLFEFASAKFTEENKDFPNIIRRLLKPVSKVTVIGYSDSYGDDAYNLKLSAQRADAVAKAINHPNISSKGLGESILLYSNDTPEGRFYCRTVDIISETPIHW